MRAIVSRLWRAFFDAGAYREVASGSTASCMAHLALAVALAWLPSLVAMTSAFAKFARETSAVLDGMPAIHIEGGEARLDPPGRYAIPIHDDPFLVLDPELSLEEALASGGGIFLTRSQLVIVGERSNETRVLELSELGDRVITKADAESWIAAIARFGPYVSYPFAAALSFGWRLAVAAAFGFVGIAIARLLKARVAWEPSFRIATLAGIPTLALGAAAAATSHAELWPAWAGIACTLAYVTFGISAVRRSEAAPSTA